MSDSLPIVNCRILERDNLGDAVCNPAYYFDDLGDEEVDIRELLSGDWLNTHHIIFGGGGILHDGLLTILDRATRLPHAGKLIFWGSGLNFGSAWIPQVYHQFMDRFDLVGVRDVGNPFEWVPCVSCMAPVFDVQRVEPAVVPFVTYCHKDARYEPNLPCNCCVRHQFNQIIRYLSLGSKVRTNSYHGAYWTRLLNREVEFNPAQHDMPCRFHWLPVTSPTLLEDCRAANVAFYNKVKKLLELP